MTSALTRRKFLTQTGIFGCSLAASPLLTPISMAATPGENRLVVIILRGGMDGIDVLRPWGDLDLMKHRPNLTARKESGLQLTEFFGVHPGLKPLLPLWKAGQLSFVQATSTPYRDKRSHFDGQDLLEAGTVELAPMGRRDGWLNRMLPYISGSHAETAFALGRESMLILTGASPASQWSPDVSVGMSGQGLRLMDMVMQSDPDMAQSMTQAIRLASADGHGAGIEFSEGELGHNDMLDSMMQSSKDARRGKSHIKIADFAAERLREETRIASFSLGGWDTHAAQARAMNKPLGALSETILRLKKKLGSLVWEKTTVLCMTEFGRTVRENGTKGTDHGTGGTMILAGGAVNGGQIHGQWPGLDEASMYDRRDLMPTSDIRAWAAWAMHDAFGMEQSTLERSVFGNLDMGARPRLLL